MPSILSGLGKASKVKEFVLEMENYYDVQRPRGTIRFPKWLLFFIDHALE